MAIAILLALLHRQRTGEGQWVDLSCTDAGLTLHGPTLLDWTVNGRPLLRPGSPDSNRSEHPALAPHGIYPAAGEDEWVALACRSDAEWRRLAQVVGAAWTREARFAALAGRLRAQDQLDAKLAEWTRARPKAETVAALQAAGVPAAPVAKPAERVDGDPATAGFGLWPTAKHSKMGDVRVDGLPVHFAKTDWEIARGGPCLGEHTEDVLTRLLGLSREEVAKLRAEGVV
jgi:crotonobetainyl-CoA:carnitine CoA-transferase CaiB-like acyl-CoA transferase